MRSEPLTRLSDVAALAGVSLATASRALSGSRDRVSHDLAERVLEAARQLNYVPNAHAQALVRSMTSTVGLVVHDVSDPYFSEIARGVLRVADERDLLVLICNSHRDPERELRYISALRAQRVQAILLAGSGYSDPGFEERAAAELEAFETTGGRVALIGRHQVSLDTVLADNEGGALAMGATLTRLGHREIGVVAGPPTLTTIDDRLRGFRRALEAADLGLPASRLVHSDFTREGGYRATRELLDRAPEISALFALNDAMAIGALAALRERGVAVPGEVSVAGFDDIPVARDVAPSLTTVRIPMEEMGSLALGLTLERPGPRRELATTSEVIERASTGPGPAQPA